jgi:choline dehydrogenase
MNIENGTRLSTALTYLTDEVWRRDNLTIRGETFVNTVRFEQQRATGVRLVGGKRSMPTRSSLPREQLDR